jgi:hypothetical protein
MGCRVTLSGIFRLKNFVYIFRRSSVDWVEWKTSKMSYRDILCKVRRVYFARHRATGPILYKSSSSIWFEVHTLTFRGGGGETELDVVI